MAEESEDKSEQPTDRKLDNARKEGQVATSIEVRTWAGLMGTLVVVALISSPLSRDLNALLLPFIERPHAFDMSPSGIGRTLTDLTFDTLQILLMPLALLLIAGVVSVVAQNGLMFVPKRIAPDFKKISPIKGLTRLFSMNNLVEFLKSLFKVSTVGIVVFLVLRGRMDEYVGLAAVDLPTILDYLRSQILHMLIIAMLLVTVLAAADWAYQRWTFTQKMKMSKQEVKDEHKQTEGDPMIKGRLRNLRMQRARSRMMAAVPDADVVVTNPTHFAVALKYDMETMGAPRLVAKGADLIAKRIREVAEENEIPLVENPPLARALFATVDIDEEIPPEHYKAVAEVIGYVMKLKGRLAH
ncbi:flagellar biosynthesis protein FlhB [Magnetospirillum molischianum]|uniref:Flagellar biosynthetic protein FlhB n=1 Tax=Magnetospirillum molischianum DSM 120 TaxID=1150626 RepID=H8FMR7_MAGML|nr:flagellar biosynthesis protein FlhB [Magnetospirillum molischianum]CCG39655.1 Flagellar biosynthetic protein flhB [Magnetospirillum molischianum DSM 120]